jgi:predicted aconitase
MSLKLCKIKVSEGEAVEVAVAVNTSDVEIKIVFYGSPYITSADWWKLASAVKTNTNHSMYFTTLNGNNGIIVADGSVKFVYELFGECCSSYTVKMKTADCVETFVEIATKIGNEETTFANKKLYGLTMHPTI